MTAQSLFGNGARSAGGLSNLKTDSEISACLLPLLAVLGWRGDPRHVAEALPHFTKIEDMGRLRAVLGNLNYASRKEKIALKELDPRLTPCLFKAKSGQTFVVLRREGTGFLVLHGQDSKVRNLDPKEITGTAYFVTPDEETNGDLRKAAAAGQWFQEVTRRFRGLVWQMLAITLVSNILAIAVPLFIMSVYDKVIGSHSYETLYFLLGGVCLALAADVSLRLLRARILAYIGGRIDMIIGTSTFQQVLYLPVYMTERASVGAQVARLRQFESIREFFTGPLAGVFLDLPFVLIFVLVIALIAGPLAWVPVALMAVFALAAVFILPLTRRQVASAGEARSQREAFMVEAISELRAIKSSAAEEVWSRRYRELSAKAALASFASGQSSQMIQTLAQFLMLSGGIATLGVGTLLVMNGTATVGALIASMALVWRILSPLQMAFLSATKLEQVGQGIKQINQLMRQKTERDPSCLVDHLRRMEGNITLDKVSLRYMTKSEPAVLGINLDIKPGEVIAITGGNGSGKSTILKLVAGLYEAQAGAVFIDGIDSRQMEVDELRNSISYVPQTCDLFYGTLAQNLRLANPIASDQDLAQAAMEAGLMEEILLFPDGFETRLTDQLQRQLPTGTKQKINLARAYVKKAPIFLLDEPASGLDNTADELLRKKIQQLRGKATTLMVTHRPSHMRLADRVVHLDGGRVSLSGPPDDVLPQLGMA